MTRTPRTPEDPASFHQRSFTGPIVALLILAALGAVVLTLVVPQGHTPSELKGERIWHEDGSYTWVRDLDPTFDLGMTLGVLAGYLLLGSILLGHKRPLARRLPGRWRVRLHISTGVTLMILAFLHAVLLFAKGAFESWPSGTLSFIVLAYHGMSGAWKNRLVRRWGAKRWRFQHLLTAYFGLALGLAHSLIL